MRRRTLLQTTLAASTIALAGCINTTEDKTTATVQDHTFKQKQPGDPSEPPELSSLEDNKLEITGTMTVANGCTFLVLATPPSFTDDQIIQTTIGTAHADDKMCTQALKDIGYRLTIKYESETMPDTVEVTQNAQKSTTTVLELPNDLHTATNE